MRIAIIADSNVADLYGTSLLQDLLSSRLQASLFPFPAGEQYKTRETKQALEDALLSEGFGRTTQLVAMGGGVSLDLGGYLAATYCRGIPLFLIPTSLLAMVDACLGGKTGVNVPQGKNLIGSFYFPKKIYINPLFLQTLPYEHIQQGMVEMIKHALITDPDFFYFLQIHAKRLLDVDLDLMELAIRKSLHIKATIIAQDPHENRQRRLLNLGHTIGHALEKLSSYTLSHGNAVAIGLLTESLLSVELGLLSPASFTKIEALLHAYRLPLQLPPNYNRTMLFEAMAFDKKGFLQFALLRDIGRACCMQIEASALDKVLDRIEQQCCV